MMSDLFKSTNEAQEVSRTMSAEQFSCVVEAIVEGKYSWACVLILRFAGYNPALYFPYRTYRRLIKENSKAKKQDQSTIAETSPVLSNSNVT